LISAASISLSPTGDSDSDSDSVFDALDEFYHATGGVHWKQAKGWGNRSENPCQWFGVCCSEQVDIRIHCEYPDWSEGNYLGSCCRAEGANLTRLLLSDNGLRGTIPPKALGTLTDLVLLDLSRNMLTSTLPPQLWELTSLAGLILHDNQLHGTLSPALDQLQHLRVLDIRFNLFEGQLPSMSSLHRLFELLLDNNHLSGSLASSLLSLPQLTLLSATENKLTGTLPPSIWHSVKFLFLYGNALSGQIPSVPASAPLQVFHAGSNAFSGQLNETDWCSSTSLVDLRLSNAGLWGGSIPSCLLTSARLQFLHLGQLGLEDDLIVPPFPYTHALAMQSLDLSNNNLRGQLHFFAPFENLFFLSLRSNHFTGSLTFETLKFHCVNCSYLPWKGVITHFDVAFNEFTQLGSTTSSIFSFIASHNQLEGDLATLSGLDAVALVDLQQNENLRGDFDPHLLQSPNLGYLFMDGTAIRSQRPGWLPLPLNFSPTQRSLFASQDDDSENENDDDDDQSSFTFTCATIFDGTSPTAIIQIPPTYFDFTSCFCSLGFYGSLEKKTKKNAANSSFSCKPCAAGYYSNTMGDTACARCAAGTYSATVGAVECTLCPSPMHVTNREGTSCSSLWPFLIFAMFSIVLFTFIMLLLVTGFMLAVMGLRVSISTLHRRRVQNLTKLIEMRARDEIPADLVIPWKDLRYDQAIGTGSYSRVFKGTWQRTLVALKELLVDQSDYESEYLVQDFQAEVKVMSQLRHPNVVLLIGACTEYPHLVIVTEYLAHGSLYHALHADDTIPLITFTQQLKWLMDTASGMSYLHERGILHRDLKSMNVLLDDTWRGKLCDFGLAKLVAAKQRVVTKATGSLMWMAPEVISEGSYSQAADIYGWSILAWEIMSPGEHLYNDKEYFVIAAAVTRDNFRPKLKQSWALGICNLMQSCWHPTVNVRPMFVDILPVIEDILREERGEPSAYGSISQSPAAPFPHPQANEMQRPLLEGQNSS
jgi:hypothetical protein